MRKLSILLALFAMTASGCANQWPFWGTAGPVRTQQRKASFYDPYGDTVAGPTIDGGRPRGYQKPYSEAERSRVINDARFNFQPQP